MLFRFGGGKRRHSLDFYAAFKSAIACSRLASHRPSISVRSLLPVGPMQRRKVAIGE